MKITSIKLYPSVRHSQRINRNQAERFFRQTKTWLDLVNQRIAELKYSKLPQTAVLEQIEDIKKALVQVENDLQWLKNHGFPNEPLLKELNLVKERIRLF